MDELEHQIDDKYFFSIPNCQLENLETEIGRYIRKFLKTRILSIFEDALYSEQFAFSDECFSFQGDPSDDDGEVFDLPKSLIKIYVNRRNDGCELYSDYQCTWNFEYDLKHLSDRDIFELVVQKEKREYDDPMGWGKMTYESIFQEIDSNSSLLSKCFIHDVNRKKAKLNLTRK